ncbi:hypothetical protein AYO49_03560 [Verrucomicrobiaceae bacterium SCGC AG-212-N21]|nr:hypothetical protein AYO49_03560 [Verrucomicrobiaceae bacterium SCGC AG-212-N21]
MSGSVGTVPQGTSGSGSARRAKISSVVGAAWIEMAIEAMPAAKKVVLNFIMLERKRAFIIKPAF